MTIHAKILGQPGRDNSLFIQIDTGQANHRLLFDCGDGCLNELSVAEIQSIDHLFFSHFHMDHVAGFDGFFRCNYNRSSKANVIWGPPGSSDILQHRFQGYWWNLCADDQAEWEVRDISAQSVKGSRFRLAESFDVRHLGTEEARANRILDLPDYSVAAIELDHNGPSMGYLVRENERQNIDVAAVRQAGLSPGPWMQKLKDPAAKNASVEVQGTLHSVSELQDRFVASSRGESIAYVTDFFVDESSLVELSDWLRDCDTLVCEAQYLHEDRDLAKQNRHMTTRKVGRLAQTAGVGKLLLFHLSSRYVDAQWSEMLEEARQEFPNTHFSSNWSAESS